MENKKIDLNCDMGEAFGAWKMGNDEKLLSLVSSANIACGFHAGDEAEMRRVVNLCFKYKVAIGAHPSFNDKQNFGRTEMDLSVSEIQYLIKDQLQILHNIVKAAGGKLHHVKPHSHSPGSPADA